MVARISRMVHVINHDDSSNDNAGRCLVHQSGAWHHLGIRHGVSKRHAASVRVMKQKATTASFLCLVAGREEYLELRTAMYLPASIQIWPAQGGIVVFEAHQRRTPPSLAP